MKKLSILAASMLFACHAQAEGINANEIYLGGGLSINDYGLSDDGTGYQIFVGMPIPVKMGKARLLGEVGFMDAGDVDVVVDLGPFGKFTQSVDGATGLWANAVVELPVAQKIDLLGRIGLDFGDDDGLMIGGGVGIALSNKIDLRFEYVIRDTIDSLQANITFGL